MTGFGITGNPTPYRVIGVFGTYAKFFLPLFESTGYNVRVNIPQQLRPFQRYFPRIKEMADARMPTSKMKLNKKKALVCFSGGRDSTAVIIKLKNEGYNVTAFYVEGANTKGHTPTELKQCRTIADILGVPLVTTKLTTTGDFPNGENPLKNQMLMAMAIDYGIHHLIGTYACGNCMEDWLHVGHEAEAKDAGTRDWTFTDVMDLFVAFKEVFEKLIPAIEIKIDALPTKADSFLIAADHAPETLIWSGGCVLPPFRRPNPRNANIRKYGAEVLLPGQCGSCYKCCCEYVFFAKLGALPMHPEYYARCAAIADTHFNILTDWNGKPPSPSFNDGIFKGHSLDPKFLKII